MVALLTTLGGVAISQDIVCVSVAESKLRNANFKTNLLEIETISYSNAPTVLHYIVMVL